MEAIVNPWPKGSNPPLSDHVRNAPEPVNPRPSRAEAEAAVRVLIAYIGDDPDREGLVGTPDRVVRAYEEVFAGYEQDPVEILHRTFEETDGYDEMVLLKDIRLESHCEHHMVPILGRVQFGSDWPFGMDLPDRTSGSPMSIPRCAGRSSAFRRTAFVRLTLRLRLHGGDRRAQ